MVVVSLIGVFTGAAVIGALAGGSLAGHANPQRLSTALTLLIILVAGYTLTRSLPGLLWRAPGHIPCRVY